MWLWNIRAIEIACRYLLKRRFKEKITSQSWFCDTVHVHTLFCSLDMTYKSEAEAEPGKAGQHPALGTGRVWGKEEEPEKKGKVFRKLILVFVDKVCRSGSSYLWSTCTPTSRSWPEGGILKSVVARVSVQCMWCWPQQSLTRLGKWRILLSKKSSIQINSGTLFSP